MNINYLHTTKFELLRNTPSKFLIEILALAKRAGVEIAIKQIKLANIVISKNPSQCYEKLVNDCIELLCKNFSHKIDLINQFKQEAFVLQTLYKYIFTQVRKLQNSNMAKEKAAFFSYLENYLTVNRHLDLKHENYLVKPLFQLEVDANIKELYALLNQIYFHEEQTRELRNILFYFNTIKASKITEIQLLPQEIKEQEKYLSLINHFWLFEHIHEMWTYLDMSISSSQSNKLNCKLTKKAQTQYCSWMIANYLSRAVLEWKYDFFHNTTRKNTKEAKEKGLDVNNVDHYLCLEFFFEFPSKISIYNVLISTWLIAYQNIKNYAQQHIKNHKVNLDSKTTLHDWFAIKSKADWITLIAGNKIEKNEVEKIFDRWVLQKNNGDIFDHVFYKIDDEYLLFSSYVSQLSPIQCLLSMADRRDNSLENRNPFEREIQATLTENHIKYLYNLNIEKNDTIVNASNRIGEFDIVFQLENTLFFIECKNFEQPFYFREHQILHEKIMDACSQLTKNVEHIVKNQYHFNQENLIIRKFFSHSWWKKKKIIKVLLTSCLLGDYLDINGCHVLSLNTFKSWLTNKEITLKNIKTMEVVEVIATKNRGSLLKRFKYLQKSIPAIAYIRKQCTMVSRKENIANTEVAFPFYHQVIPNTLFEES